MLTIGILEYGIGNCHSVKNALRELSYKAVISSDAVVLGNTDLLILPGVGSFSYGMKQLSKNNLDKFLYEVAKIKKPIIGICLGMQMFTDISYENGKHNGLGLIPGEVHPICNDSHHIGWNNIQIRTKEKFFSKFNDESYYFNHGFEYKGDDKYIIAKVEDEDPYAAIIRKDNIIGLQFHPEKSQLSGKKLLLSIIPYMINN